MAVDFYAKAGDRLPALTSQLLDGDNNPVDLTGATVSWAMRGLDGQLVAGGTGEVDEPTTQGWVRYWWDADDLAEAGTYLGEWTVTFADGRQQTYPPDRPMVIMVAPRIGDAVISPTDLDWLRGYVGSTPDDAELAARLTRYDGKRTLAALSVLRQRRADLLSDPTSYSIRGDITVNTQGNLAALDGMIADLQGQAVVDGDLADDPAASIGGAQLVRQDTWGRGWDQRSRIPS